MVTSPNKRRLYLAQEGLIDASTTGIENIIPALHLAVIEASAIANHYAEWVWGSKITSEAHSPWLSA